MLGSTRVGNVRSERELGDVPPVQGDPYTLQEVLFNLCTNAFAAMPRARVHCYFINEHDSVSRDKKGEAD